nr:C40 family peptidase [Planosporangium flavigriseum]
MELNPLITTLSPSPSGSPVVSSVPAVPPIPPVSTIPTQTAPPATTVPALVPVAAPARPSPRDIAVAYALDQLGKPYVYGAAGPKAFDCSGLVMRAWEAAGVLLPHSTYAMAKLGSRVTRDQLLPGDLVFLYNYGHVQLYIGAGRTVEAPNTGAVVRTGPLPWQVNAYVRVSDA